MVGIAAHAVAGQFRIDPGSPRLGVLVFLQHHHPRTFADHEAVPVLVPGTTGCCRIVVAGAERTRCRKTAHRQCADRCFGTAGNHHIGIAIFDDARRFADAVRTGGAGGNHRQIRAFQSVHHGQVAGNHVDDRARDEERRYFSRPCCEVIVVSILDHRQPANAGTDVYADTLGILLGYFQSGILQRLHSGNQTEMDKPVHASCIFGGKKLRDIEILHFAGNLCRHCAGIKVGDSGNAGFSRDDILPNGGNPYPDWGNDSQSGNDDSTLRQKLTPPDRKDGPTGKRIK